MRSGNGLRVILASGAALLALQAAPVLAQSASQLQSIQAQIRALNEQLARIKREMAAKDAQIKAAQDAADRARVTAEQTQATVASLPPPSGFKPGNGEGGNQFGLGIGAANPEIMAVQPKTDWASLSTGGRNATAGAQNAGNSGPLGTFHIGDVTLQLGGFAALEGLYRSRNEVTGIGSNWNAIPLRQSEAGQSGEFRLTSQQSRFSVLAEGDIDQSQHLAGYVELDLNGAAGTANSNESNSYTPRLRQFYASYDNDVLGFHALAGQSWSLATLFKSGLTPHAEDVPYTIDAQYVPGFTWARQPQLRFAEGFADNKYWLGLSFESPQTTYSVGSNGTGVPTGETANYNNPGIAQLDPGQSYSNDIAPDVILKAAADPGYGHYEVYGIATFASDRVSAVGNGHTNARVGGGVGGGFILPLIGNNLQLQLSGLAGYGIGRYGSGQLPDATIGPSGAPVLLPEVQVLGGLTAHPVPSVDLYSYVGTEQIGAKYFDEGGKAYGYGNPLYSNAGCDVELSTATCTGNTSGLTQGTLGAWWRFARGNYGTAEIGAQYSYTRRAIFNGVSAAGGGGNEPAVEQIGLFSFRYLPFQ